jgi:diguanylate cyclase (GGDEF)-like protein
MLMDTEPEEAFDRLTRLAARAVGAPVALLSLVDDRRQFFKSVSLAPGTKTLPKETPLTHSLCRHVVADRAPLVVGDLRAHEAFHDHPALAALDGVAYAGVPIFDDAGHALGALCVIDSEPHAFSEDDLSMLRDLAAATMTELSLRAKMRAQARSEAQFRAIVTNLPNGAVFLFDRQLRYTVAEGAHFTRVVGMPASVIVGRTVAEAALPENRGKLVAACERVLAGESIDLGIERNGLSFAMHLVPVANDAGHVSGGLVLAYNVTAHKRATEEATIAAERDELTGLLNRRGFLDRGREALAAPPREADAPVLFFADLNGMKRINDELGHEQGDAALVETARILLQTFGAYAVVARLGGDEFVALTRADTPGIARLTQALHDSVRALNAQPGRPFRLSLSLGAAPYDPAAPTILAMLATADGRMYAEKRERALRGGVSLVPPRA